MFFKVEDDAFQDNLVYSYQQIFEEFELGKN